MVMQPNVQSRCSGRNTNKPRILCSSANFKNGERAGNSLHGREALAKLAARQL